MLINNFNENKIATKPRKRFFSDGDKIDFEVCKLEKTILEENYFTIKNKFPISENTEMFTSFSTNFKENIDQQDEIKDDYFNTSLNTINTNSSISSLSNDEEYENDKKDLNVNNVNTNIVNEVLLKFKSLKNVLDKTNNNYNMDFEAFSNKFVSKI